MGEKNKANEIVITGTRGETVKVDIRHLNINAKGISHIDVKTDDGMSIIYIKAGRLKTVDELNM